MSLLPSLSGIVSAGYTTAKVIGAVTATTGGLLWYFQTSLIYPASQPSGSRTEVWAPPRFGMPTYEDLELKAPDGTKLRAYLILQGAQTGEEAKEAPNRPTLIFLMANAGNMGHRLPLARIFYKELKMNVLMLSYRGYGLSEGKPNESGLRMDAQTALDHVLSHSLLEKTPIVLYGQSIGGAVAIDLASRNQQRIAALVVENTFTSLPDLVPSVLPIARPFMFLLSETWPSLQSIKTISKIPVLFLSGKQDELIPPKHVHALYQACPSKMKELKEFEGAEHNDTCLATGYFEGIADFLGRHLGKIRAAPTSSDPNQTHRQDTLDGDRIAKDHVEARLEAEGADSYSLPKL